MIFVHKKCLIFKVKWSYNEAIQYDINEGTSFKEYQKNLDNATSSVSLAQFTNMTATEMLPHITESLSKSALLTFGLKVKKKRKGRKLPRTVISTIKAKNLLARQLHHAQQHSTQAEVDRLQSELDSLKMLIKDRVCDVQLQRRHRLRSRILRADPARKKFWSFLKGQIKSAGSISAVNDKRGQLVFEQEDIEEAVLQHFTTIFAGQRCPVYTADPQPQDQVELSILEIEQVLANTTPTFDQQHFEEQVCSPYSFFELEEALGKLPNGKASGYDRVPNELLKHSSYNFKLYLQSFLNRVLEDGTIPEGLNLGKCMLIHKV